MTKSKFVTDLVYVFSREADCEVVEDNARIKPTYVLSITLSLGRCASLFAMSSHSQATQSCRYRVTHCRGDLREISHLDKFLQNKFAARNGRKISTRHVLGVLVSRVFPSANLDLRCSQYKRSRGFSTERRARRAPSCCSAKFRPRQPWYRFGPSLK